MRLRHFLPAACYLIVTTLRAEPPSAPPRARSRLPAAVAGGGDALPEGHPRPPHPVSGGLRGDGSAQRRRARRPGGFLVFDDALPGPGREGRPGRPSAAQELIGYLRLGTRLDVFPVEAIRTASGQVFYLTGASGKHLLGKDIFYEAATGTAGEKGDFFCAVAAIFPTDAARRAHAAEFRESVRSIRAGEEEPLAPLDPPFPRPGTGLGPNPSLPAFTP